MSPPCRVWRRSSFTRSVTHPLAERQNGRFQARTACPRERARVKGKGRNVRGQGASEWIPPCGKAREKQLRGRGGKLAAASPRERFRVCSCSGSFCLPQELAEQRVVELVSSPTSANEQPLFGESPEMRVLESWNEMARVDFVPLGSS